MKKIKQRNKDTITEKEIDIHSIIAYCSTSIKEVINWLSFLNIMKYTEDRIYNGITLLPSLLMMFSMCHIRCFYDKVHDDQNKVKIYSY